MQCALVFGMNNNADQFLESHATTMQAVLALRDAVARLYADREEMTDETSGLVDELLKSLDVACEAAFVLDEATC